MSTKPLAFISRHTPTAEQEELAQGLGYTLVPVGDLNAFTVTIRGVALAWESARKGDPSLPVRPCGVVVVHPASAMRLLVAGYMVGVFENANRAPEGERPTFQPTELHLYRADAYEEGWIRLRVGSLDSWETEKGL